MTEKFNFYSNKKEYITTPLKNKFFLFSGMTIIASFLLLFSNTLEDFMIILLPILLPVFLYIVLMLLPTLIIYNDHKKFNADSTFTVQFEAKEYCYKDNSGEIRFKEDDIKKIVVFLPYHLYHGAFDNRNSVWNKMFYTLIILKTGERLVLSCLLFNSTNLHRYEYSKFPETDTDRTWTFVRQQVTFPNVKKGLAPASNNNLDKHTPTPIA